MPARIDEKTQFVDAAGTPIVNGSIYIGLQNADPVANPITIYSDRALTIALANPQLTDSNGRAVNKIWIPGDYSIQVNDSLAVQKMQDLDAGVTVENTGVTPLTNVAGTDTITAEGTPTILAYVDGQIYTFQAANINSGAVTVNIDGVGAKSLTKNLVTALVAGDIQANSEIVIIWNANQDLFEWINQNTVTLETSLLAALQPTGLCQFYVGLAAPAGWVLANGSSIGNAVSGATGRANADTNALYVLFYNSMADAEAPVAGGRGSGAQADFDAGKALTVSDMRGKVPVMTGGTAPATHGAAGGAETHTLVEAEIPAHTHTQLHNNVAPRSGGGVNGGSFDSTIATGSTGGDGAHNNMQPFISLTFVFKL